MQCVYEYVLVMTVFVGPTFGIKVLNKLVDCEKVLNVSDSEDHGET